MEVLTEKNCRLLTGQSLESIIELTGIYGAEPQFDYTKAKRWVALVSPICIVLEITTSLVELVININPEHKVIVNDIVNAKIAGENYGLKMLKSQVEFSKKLGFKEIHIFAQGGKKYKKYNGHISWGKVGYLMGHTSTERFENEIRIPFSRTEKDIFSLLASKDGEKIWLDHGFEWSGTFDLTENSVSNNYLEIALRRKKLI